MVESGGSGDSMTFFYCTGFGKFGNILTNPTSQLVQAMPQLLSKHPDNNKLFKLVHNEVVTVAMSDCDESLQRIYSLVE